MGSALTRLLDPASLGAGDLTVVIDGLGDHWYPHSASRKSPKFNNNPCWRITKPDAGLKGGWSYRAIYPTHTFLSLPRNQKLKHFGAVREMVVNLSLGST